MAGCYLKGIFEGQLLSAMGKDGNENMYPIAYTIVELKRKSSWEEFLDLLFNDIKSPCKRGLVMMSDIQKVMFDLCYFYILMCLYL